MIFYCPFSGTQLEDTAGGLWCPACRLGWTPAEIEATP